MEKMRRRRLTIMLTTAILLTVCVGIAPARASVTTVNLRIGIGTQSARLSIGTGSMARIGFRNGQVLGLIPTIDGDAVQLSLVDVTVEPATGAEHLEPLADLSMSTGTTVHFDGALVPIDLELLQVTTSVSSPDGAGPCTSCCVSCGDVLYCGCGVETNCGSCCCSASCGCSLLSSGSCVVRTPDAAKAPSTAQK
ncbi:MAG: hypothetical protein WCP29_13375 [Acidobacteriota bacterium]